MRSVDLFFCGLSRWSIDRILGYSCGGGPLEENHNNDDGDDANSYNGNSSDDNSSIAKATLLFQLYQNARCLPFEEIHFSCRINLLLL